MVHENKYKNIAWIDLENPTPEEVRSIMSEYNIDPIVAKDLLSPTLRTHVDTYTDYVYVVLHFPSTYSPDKNKKNRGKESESDIKKINELDFIIGRDFIITTRYSEIDALHSFTKSIEVDTILRKEGSNEHAGHVFYQMVQHLYKSILDKLDHVQDLLLDVENNIYLGKEKDMVVELSKLNRVLLTFNESISAHEGVLLSFENAGDTFFEKDFKYYLKNMVSEFRRIDTSIRTTKGYLDELRITNDSLLTTKQNEIMKVLTILAFVTFPLSLVAGLFGMNTQATPVVGHQFDFWIVLGIMFILMTLMFAFFKSRDWL